jgi:EpsI family protein
MTNWRYLVTGAVMVLASGLAFALHPIPAVEIGAVNLERQVPSSFGRWKEVKTAFVPMDLSPREGETNMDMPYDQTLMRTYVRDDGNVVMLALAYGRVLRQEVKIHRPELCYVAQGFAIRGKEATSVDLGNGSAVPAYRLLTGNDNRTEPVTYWIRIGDKISMNAWQTRSEILRDGIRGRIPDGILVRVSQALTPTVAPEASYEIEGQFLRDLYSSLDAVGKRILIGGAAT